MLNEYVNKLLALKNHVQDNLIAMGALLYEIREKKLYEEQHETFSAFLGSPEVSFCRASAMKWIRVYEVFGSTPAMLDKVRGTDVDKLYMIAGVIDEKTKPNRIVELIEKAKVLSRSDLNYDISKLLGRPTHDPAKHIKELIKEFLYEFMKGKDLNEMELEDLLYTWEKWRRQ